MRALKQDIEEELGSQVPGREPAALLHQVFQGVIPEDNCGVRISP